MDKFILFTHFPKYSVLISDKPSNSFCRDYCPISDKNSFNTKWPLKLLSYKYKQNVREANGIVGFFNITMSVIASLAFDKNGALI